MSNEQSKPQAAKDNPDRGVITAGPDAHANEGSSAATKGKAEHEVRQAEKNS